MSIKHMYPIGFASRCSACQRAMCVVGRYNTSSGTIL
jgi:hypothetical protein